MRILVFVHVVTKLAVFKKLKMMKVWNKSTINHNHSVIFPGLANLFSKSVVLFAAVYTVFLLKPGYYTVYTQYDQTKAINNFILYRSLFILNK